MGRRRSRVNSDLPPYVYRNRRGFVHREYKGSVGKRPQWGRETVLAPLDAPMSDVLRAYERLMDHRKTGTLRWLLDEYHSSSQFADLSPRSRKDYESYRNRVCDYPSRTGPFGEQDLAHITKRTIRAYLDKYKDGAAPVAANRHIQYVKAAWNWAEERYNIPSNPCAGVRLNKEEARTRYVDRDEMRAAQSQGSGYLPVLMELAYLLRARVSEVTALTESDIQEEGVQLRRTKGSEGEITLWSPSLRKAVNDARALSNGPYLLANKAGDRLKKNAIDTAMQRLMRKHTAAGGERFTLHDLKAAGYSDQELQFAGHRSERMHKTYNRKLRRVKPPE